MSYMPINVYSVHYTSTTHQASYVIHIVYFLINWESTFFLACSKLNSNSDQLSVCRSNLWFAHTGPWDGSSSEGNLSSHTGHILKPLSPSLSILICLSAWWPSSNNFLFALSLALHSVRFWGFLSKKYFSFKRQLIYHQNHY